MVPMVDHKTILMFSWAILKKTQNKLKAMIFCLLYNKLQQIFVWKSTLPGSKLCVKCPIAPSNLQA